MNPSEIEHELTAILGYDVPTNWDIPLVRKQAYLARARGHFDTNREKGEPLTGRAATYAHEQCRRAFQKALDQFQL